MNKKLRLPIELSPSMNSYVQHSYPLAIIENNKICSLHVSNDGDEWLKTRNDVSAEYLWKEQKLIINNVKGRMDTSFLMQRKCNEKDEFIVKVNEFEIRDNLSYVRMSAGSMEQKEKEEDAFFRWNQYDITVPEKLIKLDGHFNLYYRMRRTDQKIEVCASQDRYTWGLVHSQNLCVEEGLEVFFFLEIYFGENIYEYWRNMNYIQLVYNKDDTNSVWLDYFTYPRKRYDASYQEFSYFLDTEYLNLDKSMLHYDDVHSLIKNGCEEDYYINVNINELYIPERQDLEKREHFHYNLIFGFDDEARVFYALGYNQSGKLEIANIPYAVVDDLKNVGNGVVRYKKNVNTAKFEFSIDYVLNSMEEFLYGIDSSVKFMGVIGKQKGIYGINIFQELLYTERGRELITTDRRVSYLLYEHAVNMIARMKFIYQLGYLDAIKRDMILEIGNRMLKTAEFLKNKVIKNIYKGNLQDKILELLRELAELEKFFYTEAINALNNG